MILKLAFSFLVLFFAFVNINGITEIPKITLNNGANIPAIGFGTWLVSIWLFDCCSIVKTE